VTVMPVEELGVDGAVMFADIMLPLEPMGVDLEIQPEVGPIIHNPIRSADDVARLRLFDPEEGVAFTPDAIRLVRRELAGRGAHGSRRPPRARGSRRTRRSHLQPRPRRDARVRPRRGATPRRLRPRRDGAGGGRMSAITGVLLMTYGSPSSFDDVPSYLTRVR